MFNAISSSELLVAAAVLLVLGLVASLIRRHVARSHQQPQLEDASARLADEFVIKPYLQLGNQPHTAGDESVELFWHTARSNERQWSVQARIMGETSWRTAVPAVASSFVLDGVVDHKRYSARLSGLPSGARFEYRVIADGVIAFSATGSTRNAPGQPFSFVVAGDLGEPQNKWEQRIAHQIHLVQPDFLFIPGDVVYQRGRVSEYLPKFFPVYNTEEASPDFGAPLLRSIIALAAPGNHDMGMPNAAEHRDLDAFSDLFGYFQFWSQPLNGPNLPLGARNTPSLEGDPHRQRQILDNAGERYPGMACYSFDWGDSHWVVLDSNAYMDWSDPALLSWLEEDLAAAKDATWKFVAFHHPPFSSNVSHANEQRMRLLAPLFERWGVDVVFTGHNHCYERTVPLRFQPSVSTAPLYTENCPVPGQTELDTTYDGASVTRPNGVIYVTDGAGGASLHRWLVGDWKTQPFSARFDQDTHSFTVCQIDGRKLVARQISEHGREIDRWVIEK